MFLAYFLLKRQFNAEISSINHMTVNNDHRNEIQLVNNVISIKQIVLC